MSTITLKEIPRALHRELKQRAKAHGRSLNKEIIHCLEASIYPRRVDAEELLHRIQVVREQIGGYLTDEELKKMKNEGRP
jgi:plasmid stability protein